MTDADARFETAPDAGNHFAWIRTLLALQRTLMAAVRTAVSLIGFGFTVAQFFQRLQGNVPEGLRVLGPDVPRNVGLVLTGGNIDTRLLANVLLRDLARSGRLARLRIILQDRPGALFHVARIFDQEAVNILELSHQRIFTNLPAKGLSLDVECETRDGPHLERLIAALRESGYEVAPIEVA